MCPVFTECVIMIYKGDFVLELAVYHLAQMTVTLLYSCCFVIEYLLFVFHQNTPLDLADEEVMAYLKRAADPNMLEVNMWGKWKTLKCGNQTTETEVRKPKYGSEKKSRLLMSSALLTHVKAL